MARTAVSVLDGGEDAAGAGERRRQRRRWSRSANATHFSAALTSSLTTILSATTPSARPMPYRRRKEAAGAFDPFAAGFFGGEGAWRDHVFSQRSPLHTGVRF